MSARLDAQAAADFLAASRSTFLREAGAWLSTFEDPADVLILLSGEVGQHLGPWDCFRHCALLGLHHSAAVKSLALDVLSESVEEEKGPPIAPALAVAWAIDRFPEEEAPYAEVLLKQLRRQRTDPRAHPGLVDAAQLALCGPAGPVPDAAAAGLLEDLLELSLRKDEHAALAVPVWEGARLGGSSLADLAAEVAARGQQADGGLTAMSDHVLLRGFATLRGLAFERQAELQRSNPVS